MGDECIDIEYFDDHSGILDKCIEMAKESDCQRSQCGSVIVRDGRIIGVGCNTKTINEGGSCIKDILPSSFKSDRTCCIHAEQAAILDALKYREGGINGSEVYFIRLDKEGQPMAADDPYCTICSKMALWAGVYYFCLWDGKQWNGYGIHYYNKLSFQHAGIIYLDN